MSWEAVGAMAGVAGVVIAVFFGVLAYRQGKRAGLKRSIGDRAKAGKHATHPNGQSTETTDDNFPLLAFPFVLVVMAALVTLLIWYESGDIRNAERNDCIDVARRVACDDPSAQYKITKIILDQPKDSTSCAPSESVWVEHYNVSISKSAPALLCTTPVPQ